MAAVKYSEQQMDIINSSARRIVVNSVAGSGKTTTIKAIIKKAISRGIKTDKIMVCTFTRKMAKELRDKNKRILWCDTIHGIALRIVESHKQDVGYNRMILIDDIEDSDILKSTLDRNGIKMTQKRARELIDGYCSAGDINGSCKLDNIFLKTYIRTLREREFITYGLIEYYAKEILLKHPEIGFDLVVVDEYQDTSCIENDIINMLAKDKLIVVGDVMQSIYGFRGANPDNIVNIESDISYQMNTSYRVPSKIATVANNIIDMNTFNYRLHIDSKNEGGTVRIVQNRGIETLAEEIEIALKLYNPQDIFILTRTNRQIQYILSQLENIPVDRELSAVKNMKYLSYLNIAFTAYYNGYYNYGMTRLLRLFDYRDADIIAWESSGCRIHSKVKNDLAFKEFHSVMTSDRLTFMQRAENLLMMFEKQRGEYDHMMVKVLPYLDDIRSPVDYMEWYKDMSVADFMPKDKIAVITAHTAKGMENEAVLIPFVEDGTFPNTRASLQEELRLFYVAVTRAKSYLSIMQRDSVFFKEE